MEITIFMLLFFVIVLAVVSANKIEELERRIEDLENKIK